MFKKLFVGFIVMVFAFTSVPVTSYAAVEVGDNLKLFGDVRIRLEFDDRDPASGADKDSRERPRYRLRFGAKYQTAYAPLSMGFRLATGGNLNSPHTNLATASRTNHGDALDVNRAFLKLKFGESGTLLAGKFGLPLWQQTEQFWDEDIQPEGFAAAYTASLADAGSLTAAVGYVYLASNGWESDLFENDTATVWQVAHKGKVNGMGTVLAATGLHTSDGDDSGDWSGVSVDNDVAFYMFSGQINTKVDDVKLRLGADYHLSDADYTGQTDDHDEGYVVHGRASQGNIGVRYYYYDIEELSVPSYAGSLLTQDNFPNSNGTAPVGFEGHRIQLDYKIAKGVSADFRVYLEEGKSDNYGYGETANADRNRYQLNINAKF
jgi:hypothetical protein